MAELIIGAVGLVALESTVSLLHNEPITFRDEWIFSYVIGKRSIDSLPKLQHGDTMVKT
jgi:hypothetical protein